MKSESSPLTSRLPVRRPPSNGGYVLRPRPEMSSSWTGSASLRSTRREKFKRTESTLIWHIFRRNCSSEDVNDFGKLDLGEWRRGVCRRETILRFAHLFATPDRRRSSRYASL